MSMLPANPGSRSLLDADDAPAACADAAATDPHLVLNALQKISASPGFPATERSRKLLEYLVTETLEGRSNRLKAYSIATEVLGRPSSFDPQRDPIVRIEAARLRRELEHYYLTGGRDDDVIISIPKGGYVPHFVRNKTSAGEPGAQEQSPHPTIEGDKGRTVLLASATIAGLALLLLAVSLVGWRNAGGNDGAESQIHIPGLVVKPLVDLSHEGDSAVLAQGLTERIIEKTSRFKEISVIAADGGTQVPPPADARYEFGGSLRSEDGEILVQTRLVDRTDGRVIWADSLNVPLQPRQFLDAEVKIADQIATRIAEPSGVVFEAERRMWLEAPPESWNAYLCTLGAYAYRATFALQQHAGVRSCLEKAVAEHPDYATAWALLSLAYVDEIRFYYPPPEGNTLPALTRAYEAARRATELEPTNVRAQQALMMTLFFRKDYAQAVEVGEMAMSLNPNDVELKGDFGYRLAVFGKWDEGCRLLGEALDASARKVAYYKTGLALCRYYKNDLAAASQLIEEAEASQNPVYHVIAAAILAEAGDVGKAEEHRRWLQENAPGQLLSLLSEVPKRLIQPQDRQRFVESLRKAGFPAT